MEPGFYELRARHSGRSLYIDGGSGAINNGARAQQWDYTGEDNQKFGLIALGARPPCAFTDSLTSTFTGRAVLTTNNPNAPEPFPSNLNLTVKFTNCRRNVDIVTFPAIVNSFNTPLGPNTSTVTMTQGGSGPFNPSNGNMVLSMTLGFENTIRLFGNSTLPLTLTTEGNGTNGNITLDGSSIVHCNNGINMVGTGTGAGTSANVINTVVSHNNGTGLINNAGTSRLGGSTFVANGTAISMTVNNAVKTFGTNNIDGTISGGAMQLTPTQ